VKAKINNSGVVALGMCFFSLVLLNCIYMRWIGYTQTLRPGVKASFGVALDTQKLNDPSPVGPSHKVRFPFFFVLEFVLTTFILHRSVSALYLIHELDG
jgi:voltage-dependent anion channel protein 2